MRSHAQATAPSAALAAGQTANLVQIGVQSPHHLDTVMSDSQPVHQSSRCPADPTYIHKEYLYRAYYPNSKSLYALRSLNKKVFNCLRPSSATVLSKPFSNTAFSKRAFRCSAPATWNSLPRTVTDSLELLNLI